MRDSDRLEAGVWGAGLDDDLRLKTGAVVGVDATTDADREAGVLSGDSIRLRLDRVGAISADGEFRREGENREGGTRFRVEILVAGAETGGGGCGMLEELNARDLGIWISTDRSDLREVDCLGETEGSV